MVDGDGVRDGDGGGGRGGGGEGLELVERGLEADPLGLVQRELEVPHGHHHPVSRGNRRSGADGAEEGERSKAAKTLAEPELNLPKSDRRQPKNRTKPPPAGQQRKEAARLG